MGRLVSFYFESCDAPLPHPFPSLPLTFQAWRTPLAFLFHFNRLPPAGTHDTISVV